MKTLRKIGILAAGLAVAVIGITGCKNIVEVEKKSGKNSRSG